jgi:hypothetical protein
MSDTQEKERRAKLLKEWGVFDETNRKIFEICNRPNMGEWSVMQNCLDIRTAIETAIETAVKEEHHRCLSVLNRDHTKCALPQTCIGYGNARSDLENNPPIINTPR